MNPIEQLVLDLAPPEPPTFASFLPGRNAEPVAALVRFASDEANERSLFLWGGPGAGKSHLLRAAVADAMARGAATAYVSEPGALVAMDPEALASRAFVAVDAIETAGIEAQGRLFTLFNALRAAGGPAADRHPLQGTPGAKTCGRGSPGVLVYEVTPLTDEDKPGALSGYARRRGFAVRTT
jgi:DnaA family protein